jgi:hypothetical protein
MHLSHICCGRGFILARNMDPRLQHFLQPILLQRIKWYIKWYEFLSLKMNFLIKLNLIWYYISTYLFKCETLYVHYPTQLTHLIFLNCKVYIVFNNIKSWTLRYTSIWICTSIRFRWMIVIDPWIIFNTEKLIKTICKTIRIIYRIKIYQAS